MALSKEEVQELARILDARAGLGREARPKLRLVTPPTPKLLDHIAREAHLRRIDYLKRRYQLGWIVDQATFDVASASVLEDCDLIRLLCDMERAMECILDGVPFEDADLVRPVLARDAEPPAVRWSQQAEASADAASIAASALRRERRTQKDGASDPPF